MRAESYVHVAWCSPEETSAVTANGTFEPTAVPGLKDTFFTWASSRYPVSAVTAAPALSVKPAAFSGSPAAHASRKSLAVSRISSGLGGPVRAGSLCAAVSLPVAPSITL